MTLLIENYGVILLHSLIIAAICYSRTQSRWKVAEKLLSAHLCVALGLFIFTLISASSESNGGLFGIPSLSMTVMMLISFIGLVVLRFARQNLLGDPDDVRFLRWYLCTLLAVSVTISANNLVLFFLSWAMISLSLHNLLLFYPERPRAHNSLGWSLMGKPSSYENTLALEPPSRPRCVYYTDTLAKIEWDPPTTTGRPVDKYNLEQRRWRLIGGLY